MTTFSLNEQFIDLSDLTDRVEELRKERDNSDDAEELTQLEAVLDELRGGGGDHKWEGDWYPALLIREDAFEGYMDDMLEDTGELPKNLPCYLKIEIDYDALKMDYTSIDIDGDTFWYR
jgi:hypothetical protein